MGILFGRDYEEIIDDFSEALSNVQGFYVMFQMTKEEWAELNDEDREGCVRTLADDLIYGLGAERSFCVADSVVSYDPKRHLIRIEQGEALTRIVYLT